MMGPESESGEVRDGGCGCSAVVVASRMVARSK